MKPEPSPRLIEARIEEPAGLHVIPGLGNGEVIAESSEGISAARDVQKAATRSRDRSAVKQARGHAPTHVSSQNSPWGRWGPDDILLSDPAIKAMAIQHWSRSTARVCVCQPDKLPQWSHLALEHSPLRADEAIRRFNTPWEEESPDSDPYCQKPLHIRQPTPEERALAEHVLRGGLALIWTEVPDDRESNIRHLRGVATTTRNVIAHEVQRLEKLAAEKAKGKAAEKAAEKAEGK